MLPDIQKKTYLTDNLVAPSVPTGRLERTSDTTNKSHVTQTNIKQSQTTSNPQDKQPYTATPVNKVHTISQSPNQPHQNTQHSSLTGNQEVPSLCSGRPERTSDTTNKSHVTQTNIKQSQTISNPEDKQESTATPVNNEHTIPQSPNKPHQNTQDPSMAKPINKPTKKPCPTTTFTHNDDSIIISPEKSEIANTSLNQSKNNENSQSQLQSTKPLSDKSQSTSECQDKSEPATSLLDKLTSTSGLPDKSTSTVIHPEKRETSNKPANMAHSIHESQNNPESMEYPPKIEPTIESPNKSALTAELPNHSYPITKTSEKLSIPLDKQQKYMSESLKTLESSTKYTIHSHKINSTLTQSPDKSDNSQVIEEGPHKSETKTQSADKPHGSANIPDKSNTIYNEKKATRARMAVRKPSNKDLPKREYSLDVTIGGDIITLLWDGITLPDDLFNPKVVHPSSLCVTNHFIEQIPSNIGNMASYLTTINLSGNNLKDVPNEFTSLTNLTELDLSRNLFQHIPEEFEMLKNLKFLQMSHNHISEIMCSKMQSMQILYLDYNNLKEDMDKICSWNTMTELYLSHNNYSIIPTDLTNLKHLFKVDMSHNTVQTVPVFLFEMGIKQINLENNYIEVIEFEARLKRSVTEIVNISHNYFKQLPAVKYLPKLKVLMANHNFISEVKGTLDGSSCLETLDLSYNVLENIDIGGDNLPSLQVLNMKENLLKQFPDEVCNLPKLREFTITSNRLTKLEIPKCLSEIQLLNASANKIKTINDDTYHTKMPKLQVLDVSDNELCDLPVSLSELPKLQRLLASNNKFVKPPPSIMNFSHINELQLNGRKDKLVTLQTDCFNAYHSHQHLQTLVLSNQALKNIPDSISHLSALHRLDLSSNKIKNIPLCFKLLNNLLYLNLTGNELCEIEGAIVEKKPKLQELYLANNTDIKKLSFKLSKVVTLEKLDLSGCSLVVGAFQKTFDALKRLTHLWVGDNRLSKIPEVLKNLTTLETLSLKGNTIKEMVIVDHTWNSLTDLNISHNQLCCLPDEIVSLSALKILDVSHNNLAGTDDIPRHFPLLENIQSINLSSNKFRVLPAHILESASLETLNMSDNYIETLPVESVDPRNNLTSLDLSYNRICNLPPHLAAFNKLKSLDVNNNKILDFPDEFTEGMERLEYFNCSHNAIIEIPPLVSLSDKRFKECIISSNSITELETWSASTEKLSIEANKLTTFPVSVFNDMKLSELSISSNSLNELTFVKQGTNDPTTGLRVFRASLNSNIRIQPGLKNLKHLTELELIKVGMQVLLKDIGDLSFLRKINVSGNKLRNLPGFFTNLCLLEEIDVSDNEIVDHGVEDARFLLLQYLNTFNISSNKLTELVVPPDQPGTKCKLVEFKAGDNEVTTITELITRMKCIKHLDLSNNKVQRVPKEVFLNPSLESIDFGHNKIVDIQMPSIEILAESRLKEMNVENNLLTTIDLKFALFERLEMLDLRQNRISKLPPFSGAFANLSRLNINLAENPIMDIMNKEDLYKFLKESWAIEIAERTIKIILHGISLAAKENVASKILELADSDKEKLSTGCVSRCYFEHIHLVIIILDVAHYNILELMTSADTIHFICLPGMAEVKNEAKWFDENVEEYFIFLCTIFKSPIVSLIGNDESSKFTNTMGESLNKMIDKMVQSIGAKGAPQSTECSKEFTALFQKVSQRFFWNFHREVLGTSDKEINRVKVFINNVAQETQTLLGDPSTVKRDPRWMQVMHSITNHNGIFITVEMIENIARNFDLTTDEIKLALPALLTHMHYSGSAVSLASSQEITIICPNLERFFDFFKYLHAQKKLIISTVDVEQILVRLQDVAGLVPTEAFKVEEETILNMLCHQKLCYKVSRDSYCVIAMLQSSKDVLKEMSGKSAIETNVPPNHEDIIMTFTIPAMCSSLCLQRLHGAINLIVAKTSKGWRDRTDFLEGSYGTMKDCSYVLLFEGEGVSERKTIIGRCVLKLHLRCEVTEEAYLHCLTYLFVQNTLNERKEFTQEDGFGGLYDVSKELTSIISSCVSKFPLLALSDPRIEYKLGPPLNEPGNVPEHMHLQIIWYKMRFYILEEETKIPQLLVCSCIW